MFNLSVSSWLTISPGLILVISALGLLVFSALLVKRQWIMLLTVLGLSVSAVASTFWSRGFFPSQKALSHLQVDAYTSIFYLLFLGIALIFCLFAARYFNVGKVLGGEFFALVLFATFGMMIMISARDLMIMFLGFELVSITSFILANQLRMATFQESVSSRLMGRRYLWSHGISSAFFLIGLGYLYGANGSLRYDVVAVQFDVDLLNMTYLWMGSAFVVLGFLFKTATILVNLWLPEQAEGKALPLTGLLAVAVNAAVFLTISRFLTIHFYLDSSSFVSSLLIVLCVGAMVIGSLLALLQRSMKQLLAYASIAHMGYLMMVFVVRELPMAAGTSLLFYLLIYSLVMIGTFSVILIFEQASARQLRIEQYAGMASRFPALSVALALFLLSLAGFPATAGFVAKWMLFSVVMKAGFGWLAMIGVATSLLALLCYLRIIFLMFFLSSETVTLSTNSPYPTEQRVMLAAVFLVVLFGFLPQAAVSKIQNEAAVSGWNTTSITSFHRLQKVLRDTRWSRYQKAPSNVRVTESPSLQEEATEEKRNEIRKPVVLKKPTTRKVMLLPLSRPTSRAWPSSSPSPEPTF